MAPECFYPMKDRKIDGGVDVWAIGVILYGMLVGELPFKGTNSYEKIEQIKAARYRIPKDIASELSEECIDAMKRCLDPSPKSRIKIADLLMHPWCTDMTLPEYKFIIS
jgi:serine/threonine protein kinase